MREINEITGAIVDSAYHIHTRLGPGLLESVYEAILARTLEKRGLLVERQKRIPIEYEDLYFEEAFRADMVVDGKVIVELKSVEQLGPVPPKQLLTYLRLLDLPIGLLINFGAPTIKTGIHRIVNTHAPSAQLHVRPKP
jgi:GxxExxY protein